MARMSSLKESCLLCVIKFTAAVFRLLPYRMALAIAHVFGNLCFYVLPKKRRIITRNLKIVFAALKTPQEIRALTRAVFISVTKSFVDVMCLPKIKKEGWKNFVRFEGEEHIQDALAKQKGLILVGIHSGSWELASLVGSTLGYAYNVVANEQPKVPRINDLLTQYRAAAGAKIIAPGTGVTRDIIRALQNNELVSLVLDQGGKEGVITDLLGRTASMSTGALRLALKLKAPICPVWIERQADGLNKLRVLKALDLRDLDDSAAGLKEALTRAVKIFDELLRAHPQEYLWSYKVFKYSNQAGVLIIDDGKTGHLRQSEAAAAKLSSVLRKRGFAVSQKSVRIEFQSRFKARMFALYVWVLSLSGLDADESDLSFFLTPEASERLFKERADWVISSGSAAGGINFFLKRCLDIRSVCILKAGLVPWRHFDLAIAPEHDHKNDVKGDRTIYTKAALNVITPAYLRTQEELLLSQYSHLKGNVRFKIGVLLGGNTKGVEFDEVQIRLLVNKLKEAAVHYNADILITTSRRTPPEVEGVVLKELKNFERTALCVIANSNNAPYVMGGILSLSDLVIVSGESISMVSEALSSGKRTIVFKPVGTYDQKEAADKFDRFVMGLSDQGFVLACSIKEVANGITKMMSNKIVLKTLPDNALVEKAFENMLS